MEALRALDRVTYFVDCFIELDENERTIILESLADSGLIRKLEARLAQIAKEEGYDGGKLPMAG